MLAFDVNDNGKQKQTVNSLFFVPSAVHCFLCIDVFFLLPQKEEVCLKQKHFIYFLQSISVFLSSTKNNQPVKYFPLVQLFFSNSFTQ